MNEVILF